MMNLPDVVRFHLDQHGFPYRLIDCPSVESLDQAAAKLDIPPRQIVRTVLLRDRAGLVMAILPCSYILDFSILCQALQRDLDPLYGIETHHFFEQYGCQTGCHPPLPGAFAIPALADASLVADEDAEVYFDGGNGDVLVSMRAVDFRQVLATARWGHFAVSTEDLDALLSQQAATPQNLVNLTRRYTPAQLREGIEAITELPVMPQTVQWIMALRAKSDVTVKEILQVAEYDPSLAAQVVYWARSPLHGYQGPVDSLETAIQQVLGIENTLNLLLGSCMGQTFHIPVDGPVGLQTFWRHSIYCASLISELVKLLPEPTNVKPGLAYLCGLLHDFGYLVLGHVFPARFFLFNRFLAVNRSVPLDVVERYVLGVEHWHIGAWLMQSWAMPEEVIAAVRWHHNEDCTQPHAEYSNLVLIANRLLRYAGLGEESNHRLPALVMFTLGITREQAMEALDRVQSSMAELDSLSTALRLPAEG
ncbi:MAG TPA: HDOD domain-containing protein [Candidatus Competibacteraceae bacterium]|nr:HDOD domain-containing protein [Candidatus Competibacteraceae bacterium]HRZ04678.1 HDOD domain-containing protein [Candidatus Competibacteraceae bacterium]HSA45023.1 HDOD domain-containing protein [Candidatus Competibacteraceae bacterium]